MLSACSSSQSNFFVQFKFWYFSVVCSLLEEKPGVLILLAGDIPYHLPGLLCPLGTEVNEQSQLLQWHIQVLEQPQRKDTLKTQSRECITDLQFLWRKPYGIPQVVFLLSFLRWRGLKDIQSLSSRGTVNISKNLQGRGLTSCLGAHESSICLGAAIPCTYSYDKQALFPGITSFLSVWLSVTACRGQLSPAQHGCMNKARDFNLGTRLYCLMSCLCASRQLRSALAHLRDSSLGPGAFSHSYGHSWLCIHLQHHVLSCVGTNYLMRTLKTHLLHSLSSLVPDSTPAKHFFSQFDAEQNQLLKYFVSLKLPGW